MEVSDVLDGGGGGGDDDDDSGGGDNGGGDDDDNDGGDGDDDDDGVDDDSDDKRYYNFFFSYIVTLHPGQCLWKRFVHTVVNRRLHRNTSELSTVLEVNLATRSVSFP